MKEIFKKILGSLDTIKGSGYSARKLSALVVIIMVVIAHIKWFQSDKWEYFGEVLIIDFSFVSVCLGMTTYENVKWSKDNKE